MGKQRIGAGLARRVVDERGQPVALGVGEIEAFTRHLTPPSAAPPQLRPSQAGR